MVSSDTSGVALQCLVTTDLEIRTSRNTESEIYLGVPKGYAVPSPLVVVV
jgi:hypothetical protein